MAKAKSAWEDFSSSNPYYLRSALNVNPVTGGLARLADAYTKYDKGDTQGALLGLAPGGGTVDKVLKGDLAGAAKDTLLGMAPPIVGTAYNYAMNDKQDPDAASVEDRSTYSSEMQDERAAADNAAGEAAYYGGGGGYGGYGGGNLSEYSGGGGGMDRDGSDKVMAYKRGGKVKAYAKGGAVSSKPVKSTRGRGDGIAQRGHTKGRIV
jgi:hypothetical protein